MKFRKHIRLKEYDYSTDGYYFVTVVTYNRLPLFKNCSGECELAIKNLPKFVSGLSIDWFVVMDDHIHIIFVFENCSRTLGRVVSAMKCVITKIVTASVNSPQDVAVNVNSQNKADLHRPQQSIWQWNYYEHIVRNEKALDKIRKYIENNPDIEKPDWEKLDK